MSVIAKRTRRAIPIDVIPTLMGFAGVPVKSRAKLEIESIKTDTNGAVANAPTRDRRNVLVTKIPRGKITMSAITQASAN